jgi:hypothetical protein
LTAGRPAATITLVTSRAGYWIGAGLVLAAVAAAILWAVLSFVGITNTVDDFLRVPAPGAQPVQLEARKYIVYLEGPGADEGTVPPLQFSIADARNERPLQVSHYAGSLTYSFGGHSGTAAGTITPPRAGAYLVSARSEFDASAGLGVALGDSIGGKIVRTIVGALLIGALLAIAGIGLIAATAVRRNRRRPPPAGPATAAWIAGLEP